MSDQIPNQDKENEILNELRNLGDNISALLRGAWESEERQRLQRDLETGFNELRENLHNVADSAVGKTIRQDFEDFGERVRAGEVERAVRSEVLSALRMANEGLKKAAEKRTHPQENPTSAESSDSDSASSG
jgi:hypothetical protein